MARHTDGPANSDGPLRGIVIADFTQLVQGPFATQILGDLGADVLKIEPPQGDWLRRFSLGNFYLRGESVSFLSFNRHKRSVAINLKHPRGREAALRLIDQADVLVENFRPGVMERLELGYDKLSARNPALIYCASSGFGPTGPYRDRPGQDLLIQAMTGLVTLNGTCSDPPVPVGIGIADLIASHHIVYGILAALYERERTGRGQRVDVNLLNALLTLEMQEMTTFLNGGGPPERSRTGIPPYLGAPYGIYQTADGYIAIAMNPVNRLARLLGVDGYEGINASNVMENRDQIRHDLQRALQGKTTAEWLRVLLPEDIWCGPVQTFAEVELDPQIAENDMLTTYVHSTAGTVRTLGVPIKFNNVPTAVRRVPPLLGEHTDEILREIAGYTVHEVRQLRDEGAIV